MGNKIGRAARLWWGYMRETKAVSALEYAILVGVIAVAIAAVLTTFSGNLKTAITNIGTQVGATAKQKVIDLDP